MSRSELFSKYEAVLLLDAYLDFIATGKPRSQAVKRVSNDLRQMAVNNGMLIDDTYRNANGISFQMASMESAYVGRTILKPATKLFTEIVAMLRNNREEYDKLLKEARSMVGDKKKNEDLFAAWLAQNVPTARRSDVFPCCSEIEAYCIKRKVLNKPLFETTDSGTVQKVQKAVIESHAFSFYRKVQLVVAIRYYVAFVETLGVRRAKGHKVNTAKNALKNLPKATTKDIPKNQPKATSQNFSKNVPIINHGAMGENKTLKVDFNRTVDLAYTRPISFVYFGMRHADISNWTQLYVQVVKCLSDDYSAQFLKMFNSNISGSGRIDIGSKKASEKMTAPKKVRNNFYVETNLSAKDLVGKIRILLDRCGIGYENLEIFYEEQNTAKHAPIAAHSERVNIDPSVESFRNWMVNDQNMAKGSAQNYISAIANCEQLARQLHLPELQIYGTDYATAQRFKEQLMHSSAYGELNASQQRRYRSALEKYVLYLSGGDDHGCTSVSVNSSNQGIDTKPFENVLEQYFVKGFRLGSALEMKKFRRFYEEINGVPMNMEDAAIEKIIRRCGIVHDDKVFLPKTMLDEDMKAKLRKYIEDSFNSGKNSIYFEALFREFSDDFLDHYIYNADMLRSYLMFECGDEYIIGRNQISKEAGVSVEAIEEVRYCLKSHGSPMDKDEIYAVLTHLPKSKIDTILSCNLEFVRNGKGVYFHADMIELSEEELENIAELIENAIRVHGYISGSELMNDIRAKYPRMYENYSGYSDIGWRDALKYKFGDRFSFKGNLISSTGTTLSMSDVFGQLAAEAETITVDELMAFAEDMGSPIYFDAVYQNALRIDEDTFVSRKRAKFNVKETDAIIDRFCTGDYIPLAAVRDFGIFPDAGFPWTEYLLESYAAFYSERYMLLHGGYNRNCAVGAIVKKSAGYAGFDDLVVDVMANSGISLNKQDALDYLADSGYIARRSYTNIEDLMIQANAKRNRKGRS